MSKWKYILLFVVLCCISCNNNTSCRVTNDIALKIGFYSETTDSLGTTTVLSKAIDSITIQGIGSDSILYNNAKSVSSVSLPLHNTLNTTSYAMTVNGVQDTLVVNHQNNDLFVSLECGCFTYHTIESVTETARFFDSIAFIEYEIGRTQTENIQLFWH